MKENKRNLTQAIVERSTCIGESYTFLWDIKQEGLGVKIEPSGHKSYVYRYRWEGKEKRKVLSGCLQITLDQARIVANGHAFTLSKGVDPFLVKDIRTVDSVCREYLKIRTGGRGREKKVAETTAIGWRQQIDKHITKNAFGSLDIDKVTLPIAIKYFDSLSETPVQANRVRSLLNLVFKYAVKKGYRTSDTNIWQDYVDKYEETPYRPRLIESDDQEKDHPTLFLDYMVRAERGEILDKRGCKIDLSWIFQIWTIYFTGARPREIVDIKISDIDFENSIIHRKSTKTGAKDVHIAGSLIDILKRAIVLIPRKDGNEYLFAGLEGKGYRKTYGGKMWDALREETGITAPPYALRRYFATIGKRIHNGNIEIVSKIMDHQSTKMTEVYAGEDRDTLIKERKIINFETEKLVKALNEKIKSA